ncbi:hypothetical protein RHO14_06885 [Orbus wheelerorum]|uniref:hypothetical protein n=1 Tax=Orbus wheelerorum TaxID=3074111 RepID=UPI00370D3388
MNQDLSTSFGGAYVTIARYSELSGMEINTIKSYVKQGLLPVRSKKIAGKKSLVLINNAQLVAEALNKDNLTVTL